MDKHVEKWKVKKLIRQLENARGSGTSMISLVLSPKDQISHVQSMLADEYGTASNIKSRVNRLSVLGAITSVQQRLKLYPRVPDNGLIIYCGTVITDEGKEKKVNIDFEPFGSINASLYLCDNTFHTEVLRSLFEYDKKFGFVIMDGNGCLFGTLCGNTREILHTFTVDLPRKHDRGGQSALRFARLRMEKRHNYVRKVAEVSANLYLINGRINVDGLILAGSAEFRTDLGRSDMFDRRLQEMIIKTVDVSYGGETGFDQAIELAADALSDVNLVKEKKHISAYFTEVSKDSGRYCYGVADTLRALELGAVRTLIVWEDLDVVRFEIKDSSIEGSHIIYLRAEEERDGSHYVDPDTGDNREILYKSLLVEWIANNYKGFGARLEIISDRSQEGVQFCRGFGGIGGVLRYRVDFNAMDGCDVFDNVDEYM